MVDATSARGCSAADFIPESCGSAFTVCPDLQHAVRSACFATQDVQAVTCMGDSVAYRSTGLRSNRRRRSRTAS